MEQIYYTQCPMGYGLGASNGFQIKRLSAGYPAGGDVRHLAMRAFRPGTSNQAPGALRYRRVGEAADVAWLTPRAREYETERGLWGRPGGHFAHGVRLEPAELDRLARWPAGLFDRPCWRRSDPEPSRGRRPDELALGPDDLLAPPTFEAVAPRIDLDAEALARLLAAAAEAVRSGRTLFLIDEADRLGPHIAALTFAFPGPLRADLTFSTYHDRPEELSGFRIQGTCPSPLLNRAMLGGLGPIADLTTSRFEPSTAPPSWAVALATWLTRRSDRDAASWTETEARASRCRLPDDPIEQWSDAWLDGLVGMAQASRTPAPIPTDGDACRRLADQASWARRVGLSGELLRGRPPAWWSSLLKENPRDRDVHKAFWSLIRAPESWEGGCLDDAIGWGRTTGCFWKLLPATQRKDYLTALVRRIAPADRLARFLDAMMTAAGANAAEAGIAWLRGRLEPEVGPAVLVSLEARLAVERLIEQERHDLIADVIGRAAALGDALPTVLDLIAAEARRRRSSRAVSAAVADAFAADPDALPDFEDWALRRLAAGGDDWLGPSWSRLFATTIDRDEWRALRDRTPAALRPTLARSALAAAVAKEATPEALEWAVESLLLPIPPAGRPAEHDRAGPYLDRIGSPLTLAARLRSCPADLLGWLRAADRLGPGHRALVDDAETLADLLNDRSTALPGDDLLGRLPADDRPDVLALLLRHLAGHDLHRAWPILDAVARCWPDAFEADSPVLDGFAGPLAVLLKPAMTDPTAWLDDLDGLLARLGVDPAGPGGRSPGGLAAAVLAATCRLDDVDPAAAWKLRSAVLSLEPRAPLLAGDLGRDLAAAPVGRAAEVVTQWESKLDKGEDSNRFFEVVLNACDGPRLATVVPAYADALRTLGPLRWWSAKECVGLPPDLRERFALRVPMAPLPGRCLPALGRWILQEAAGPVTSIRKEHHDELIPVFDAPSRRGPPTADLDPAAAARWACLRALSEFHAAVKQPADRWVEFLRWRKGNAPPPVEGLGPDDRYAFVAWLIAGLDFPGSGSYQVADVFARWVARDLKLTDRARLRCWPNDLGPTGRPPTPDQERLGRDLAYEVGNQ